MTKTVTQSLVSVLVSMAVMFLLLLDLDWGLILSYVVLAFVVLAGLAFWFVVAVSLICCLWSWILPRRAKC